MAAVPLVEGSGGKPGDYKRATRRASAALVREQQKECMEGNLGGRESAKGATEAQAKGARTSCQAAARAAYEAVSGDTDPRGYDRVVSPARGA